MKLLRKRLFISLYFCILLFVMFTGCRSREKKQDLLLIARDSSFYPLNLVGKGNNLLAFTDEVIFAIAKEEDLVIDFIQVPSNNLYSGLNEKRYDAILSLETQTTQKMNKYDYSEPIFLVGPILVVPIGSKAVSLQDMTDKVVGIQEDASVVFNVNSVPGIIFTPFENILFALKSLTEGQIDGLIMETVPAYEYTYSFYDGDLKVISPPLTDDGLLLVTLRNKKEESFVNKFNRGLQTIKQNGTYDKLLKRWDLHQPAVQHLPEESESEES